MKAEEEVQPEEAAPAESAPELPAGVTIKEAEKVQEEDKEKTPTPEPAVSAINVVKS